MQYRGWASGAFLFLVLPRRYFFTTINASNKASGRLAVSLCLVRKRLRKTHPRMVLSVDPSGIYKFCNARCHPVVFAANIQSMDVQSLDKTSPLGACFRSFHDGGLEKITRDQE